MTQLTDSIKDVLLDAEDLMKQASQASSEKAVILRQNAMERIRFVKERLEDAADYSVEKTKAAARATDDYVHDNPWKAVGIAAGVGFLVGLLINRRQ